MNKQAFLIHCLKKTLGKLIDDFVMRETLRHMMITESDKRAAQLALQGASSATVGLVRRIRLRTHRASPSLAPIP